MKVLFDDDFKSIDCVPYGVEVLAFHIKGKSFHQVKIDASGKATMRWNHLYSQRAVDFEGFITMPMLNSRG